MKSSINKKIYLITLGCDKNRVDGEVMLGLLSKEGFEITATPSEADAIIVNTCGFIQDAVRESIETVLELAAHKQNKCRVLIIAGCMAERYKDEVLKEIPEADALIGVADYLTCGQVARTLLGETDTVEKKPPDLTACRLLGHSFYGMNHIAYVKIAEGCDNGCTYCTIPSIRGRYVRRSKREIINECRLLAGQGARELILVAQDTAKHPDLPEIIGEISAIDEVRWVRLMYAHPEHITPELIQALTLKKVTPYIDMPIQHINDDVLKRMGRRIKKAEIIKLIQILRETVPGIALRTTIMTGFPGETEAAFDELCVFLREVGFERLGVFGYSREEGTPAARMKNQVKPDEIAARRDKLMLIQQEIHTKKQQALTGQVLDVMADRANPGGTFVGRTTSDAPDVDGEVTVSGTAAAGTLTRVLITGADEYDLQGKLYE
jgi:ribosomal protein S12 methylthiotransferase